MTTLIIARHGNTFEAGEPPRRVGRRTDLPLTATGRAQAAAIGGWLKANGLMPDVVYCSTLRRTIETASLAVEATGLRQPVFQLAILDEIDYGPDENGTEAEVVARIGGDAIAAWDRDGVVPPGWLADPDALRRTWRDFAAGIRAHDDGETVLAVTSNGIARFAPCLTLDHVATAKLKTGALGVLQYRDGAWRLQGWGLLP